MVTALLLLLVAALAAGRLLRRSAFAGTYLAPLPFLAALGLLLQHAPNVLAGEVVLETIAHIAPLRAAIALRLDGLGLLFGLLVCVVGALVLVHSAGYLHASPKTHARFASVATLFAAAMLGLVLADDLLFLFVCWELTTLCSFLLVGLEHEQEAARKGAMRALVVTGAGGIALLVGLLLLGAAAGTTSIDALLERGEQVRRSALYLPALLLVFAGALTKSAQVPFHYWLPGAMAAPSPVSAFLHSATLVKAGVFLLLRLHPVLGFRPEWHVILAVAGAATMLVGAALAFAQTDLKSLLAYTTVAGLGTLVFLLGIGTVPALRAALLLLAVHALYKASLFMVTGFLDQRTGTRDVRELGGLARLAPFAFAAAALAALSMCGLPPLLGAIAKELVYEAKLGAPAAPLALTTVGTVSNALIVACALMVGVLPYLARRTPPKLRPVQATRLLLGPVVLSCVGLALGVLHDTHAAPLIDAALAAVHGEPPTAEMRLDASAQTVAWLGKGTLAAGVLLFLLRTRILAALGWCRRLAPLGPSALHERAFAGVFALADAVSRRSSVLVVRRSLIVGFCLLLLAVGVPFVTGGLPSWPAERRAIGLHEALLLALIVAGVAVAVRARSHLTSIAALGAAGFGVGMVFLLLGGPDLALTQIAVETLVVLLLLLALRRSTADTTPQPRLRRIVDGLLATGVGVAFTLVAWAATPDGSIPPAAAHMAAASEPLAFGRNVVNVILVDFRALDTLGEIFVLAIASVGVVALLAIPARGGGAAPARTIALGDAPILRSAARTLAPLLLLLAVVLIIRGHHEPGGGFVAGLVAAAAAMLSALILGIDGARARVTPQRLIVAGLAIALLAGLIGPLVGREFLASLWLDLRVPTIGKLGTPLLFDLGVFLVVLGVATRVLFALQSEAGAD